MLWKFHRRHTFVGIVLAVMAGLISWSLLAWMSPALIGLGISIPLAAFVSSRTIGDGLRGWGLMTTPEERHRPAIATAADEAAEAFETGVRPPASVPALIEDHQALRRHMAWLDAHTQRRSGEIDPTLAAGWLKLTDGVEIDDLSTSEIYAVLASGKMMRKLVTADVVI